MPKQVSTHEYMINLEVPLANAEKTHQHFTNLQLGMQMGRKILEDAAGGAEADVYYYGRLKLTRSGWGDAVF